MCDQLPGSPGKLSEEGVQRGCIEDAGRCDSEGTVGGCEAFLGDDAVEGRLETAEEPDFDSAERGGAACGAEAPCWFKGIADCVDSGSTGRSQDWAQHGGGSGERRGGEEWKTWEAP